MADSDDAPIIVFDLDGTLVDTAADLIGTLNVLLLREGYAPVPRADVGTFVGAGARVMIERGLAANRASTDAARVDRLFADFIEHYGANIAAESRPYPGVVEALDRFAQAGWRLAVCTNKTEALSRRLLAELGLAERFAAICGGDTFPVRKPDPGHLVGTVTAGGGRPERAVMVGDSRADIEAAKRAGIPVVAVDFGYTDRPVAEFGPDVVIGHFDALWTAVAGLAQAWDADETGIAVSA